MKTLLNKLITIAIVVAVIAGLWYTVKAYKREMKRIESNYIALMEQMKNDNVENNRIFNLKVDEMMKYYPEIKQQLKDMDIKLKNVVSIQNVNTETNTFIKTILRDSIIHDTIPVHVASYVDEWTRFALLIQDSIVTADYNTRDSLFIVLNKVPRNFWEWLRREPRTVNSTVKNYNPNSEIKFNRLIQIDK